MRLMGVLGLGCRNTRREWGPFFLLNIILMVPISLYYQNDPAQLSSCPLTIHALLHIPDGITAIGPVWTYWAFPMERHCNSLLPAIRSRSHPNQSTLSSPQRPTLIKSGCCIISMLNFAWILTSRNLLALYIIYVCPTISLSINDCSSTK